MLFTRALPSLREHSALAALVDAWELGVSRDNSLLLCTKRIIILQNFHYGILSSLVDFVRFLIIALKTLVGAQIRHS